MNHPHKQRSPAICLLFLLFSCLSTFGDDVDDYVKAAMARQHIPGLSLAVIRDGKMLKSQSYGLASVELNVSAKSETVFELASAAKPFVATAIMLLMQEGKLNLDDPIAKFVGNTPDSWRPVTLRHLLSHTSGIKDYLERPEMTPFNLPPERIVQIAAAFPLNFQPGEKWAYSNTGYVLLGMVIQKVSGKPFGAFLEERIFKSLDMVDTRHHQPDAVIANRATGYLWLGTGGLRNADMFKYMMSNRGDAGILSTAPDLAKWIPALISGQLLTSASRETMWTQSRLNNGATCLYGLGWFVGEVNGHRHVYHPGGNPGAATIISLYPDDKLAIILLANGGRAYPEGLDMGIAQRFIPDLVPHAVGLDAALLDSYTGYYNAYGRQLLEVTRDKDVLLLNDGGGLANLFMPLSTTNFVAEDANRGCLFWRSTNGEVTGLTLRLGTDELPVQRIGPPIRSLKPVPDPDPALTQRVEAVLKAFAQGSKAVEEVFGVAEGARKHYARGPAPELAGIQSVSFITMQDVATRGISRYGGKVSRILYCKMLAGQVSRHLLVYLTADGLVTDQDVLRE